ncbi:hypothetical protein Dimus_008549, partial [Dionaea muscipula]
MGRGCHDGLGLQEMPDVELHGFRDVGLTMDVGSSHGPLVGEELGGLVCGLNHFKAASHVDGGLPHGVLHGSGEALPRKPDCVVLRPPSTIGDAEEVEMVLLSDELRRETTSRAGGEDGRWCLMVVMVWVGGEPPRRWQPRVGLLSVDDVFWIDEDDAGQDNARRWSGVVSSTQSRRRGIEDEDGSSI